MYSSFILGWRRTGHENDLIDILLPDGEDYRLVFVNSDSSSKEEDVDDNDSSSASSFPLDECDWDYFEPGAALPQQVLGWTSPFGSPRVCRKRFIDSPLSKYLKLDKHILESEFAFFDAYLSMAMRINNCVCSMAVKKRKSVIFL